MSSAQNVVSWDVHVVRDFHPFYLLDGTRAGCLDSSRPTVTISVEFDNDVSAMEFEAKVRAMLPEAGHA